MDETQKTGGKRTKKIKLNGNGIYLHTNEHHVVDMNGNCPYHRDFIKLKSIEHGIKLEYER